MNEYRGGLTEMSDRTGEQFGLYRLVRFIEAGGFGEVYEGKHPRRGQVALKLLKMRLDESGLHHFLNDVRAVLLRHPQIIEIVDFGVEGQTPYLAMPYLSSGSVRSRLPLPTVVNYVQQIASALQYAHDEGTIHRDVKPENVLLGPGGQLVLADFGIAVAFDQSKTHRTVDFAGTPDYASPEQFLTRPGPASDQYALGTMAYEWLTGDVPFHAENWMALGMKKVQQPAPRLPSVPAVVEQVVLRALATDPKCRFPSVHTFAEALAAAQPPDKPRLTRGKQA